MRIVKQSFEFLREPDGEDMLRVIEQAGRTCYKSEDHITDDSARGFVQKMISSGHHAMIEFALPPPVKVITDRGVTHEIVRHRLFSFAQESTRYCNYGKGKFGSETTVVLPVWFNKAHADTERLTVGGEALYAGYNSWLAACEMAEKYYFELLGLGQSPQQARSVLLNSLKAEINICGNVREWRQFFTLRCSAKAHPQMRELARDMLGGFREKIPVIFDDITY
jgi:thymidylate synthase (FAD)